ncbi:MAG: hypothetical protein AVDCRST_MAG08-2326, partial [uncultured Acetobacteraceae bacterium]
AGTQLDRSRDRRGDPRRRFVVPWLRRAEQRARHGDGRWRWHPAHRPVRPHRRPIERRRRPHRRGPRRQRNRHSHRPADLQRGTHLPGGPRPALAGRHLRRDNVRGAVGRPLRVIGAGRQRPGAGRRRPDHPDAGLREPRSAARALHLLRHADQFRQPEPAGAGGGAGRRRGRRRAAV